MSETTNLKLKKHDNPETNTDKFDVENYLNGNWDKIDKNVGEVSTNISNINSKNKEQDTNIEQLQENTETSNNKIEKLETELKEMQEDFYQNSIRGQASGEYIHVEDSSNCRSIIGLSGNSEQETRSGKNKFIPLPTGTNSGLTITKNEDGTYNITGTATANIEHIAFVDLDSSEIKNGSTYILSSTKTLPEGLSARVEMYNGTKWVRQFIPSINSTTLTNTGTVNTTDTTRIRFGIFATSGAKIDIQNIGFQLEEGTIATEYEQFGVSPSPDFSSEIKSVGDNINLFDGSFRQGTHVSLTQANRIISQNVIKSVKGNNYTISTNLSSEYNYKIQNDNTNEIENVNVIDDTSYTSKSSLTIKCTQSGYLKILVNKNDGSSITPAEMSKYYFKVEKGLVATSYSLHGQGCITEVISNKNLINIFARNGTKETTNGIEFTVNKDGTVTVNGTNTSNSWTYFIVIGENTKGYNRNSFVDNNIYYLIGAPKGASYSTYRLQFYDGGSNTIKFDYNSGVTVSRTIKNKGWNIAIGIAGGATVNNIVFKPMLLKGDYTGKTLPDYEQHKEQSYIIPTQQAFKSIGNIRDTFIKIDDKWYERHNINRKKLDGTENWLMIDKNSIFGIRMTEQQAKINIQQSAQNLTECLSNRLINSMQLDIVKVTNGIAFSQWTDTQYLYLSKIKDSVDELKSYLAANETYVDYPLETPIDIECTEEQSKILEELNNARTYKNETNITTDSIAIIDLDYAKDLETLLNNTQALAVNNASEGV